MRPRESRRLSGRALAWLGVVGSVFALLTAAGAIAQTPNTSMLDVRLHTSEYEHYEHRSHADSIPVATLNAHQRLLQSTASQPNAELAKAGVYRYVQVRNRLRAALQNRRLELGQKQRGVEQELLPLRQLQTRAHQTIADLDTKKQQEKRGLTPEEQGKRQQAEQTLDSVDTAMRPLRDTARVLQLQLAVVDLTERHISCEEQHAPGDKSLASVVKAWYDERQRALESLLNAPYDDNPTLKADPFAVKQRSDLLGIVDSLSGLIEYKCGPCHCNSQAYAEAAGQGGGGGKKADASTTSADAATADAEAEPAADKETETTLFVNGLAQALYTGARLVPTPALKADVVRYSHQRCAALIGSLEVMGLNDDELKKLDPKAMRINYLHPEVSQFASHLTLGVCTRANVEDVKYKKAFVGLLWRGSYLRRSLPDSAAATQDTTGNKVIPYAGTDHIMSNITLEFVVPKLNLAFFGGYTYQEAVGNLDKFQEIMRTGFRSQSYFNWGVRGRLNVGKTKGDQNRQNINFEVGFIQINNRLSRFLETRDSLIPVVRVGFTHRFLDNL